METQGTKLALLKSMFTVRNAVRTGIIFLVALMAWYQFNGTEKDMFALLKSDTSSLVHSARTFLASSFTNEKLSTVSTDTAVETDHINATWQFKKAVAGESVWGVYAEMVKGNKEIAFQTQVINGLKNITVLQNGISVDRVGHNSLITGEEYSFLHSDAVAIYAGKVKEANEKLQGGSRLSELSPDLQLAYQLANAPSYQFLYSLSVDTVHSAYQ